MQRKLCNTWTVRGWCLIYAFRKLIFPLNRAVMRKSDVGRNGGVGGIKFGEMTVRKLLSCSRRRIDLKSIVDS
jgi:hypothetical protein